MIGLPNSSDKYSQENEAQTRSALLVAITTLQSQVQALARVTNTASPSGAYLEGAFVWNSAPAVVLGKILLGWTCTASGNPATFSPVYVTNS